MMVLYFDRSPTTMNDTINVFNHGSSLIVTGRVVVPTGETESPVNPVGVDVTGRRYTMFLDPKVISESRSIVDLFSTTDPVGLGQELKLARKLSLNSFVSESKEEMDDGLSRLYHIRLGPLRVVGKARHIRESEVS
ncbi:hypothetical protein GW17_00050037 [Ensete ventricosum]|nr:hypothetical protein GW17_00050037 [Ensete ventricosum]